MFWQEPLKQYKPEEAQTSQSIDKAVATAEYFSEFRYLIVPVYHLINEKDSKKSQFFVSKR